MRQGFHDGKNNVYCGHSRLRLIDGTLANVATGERQKLFIIGRLLQKICYAPKKYAGKGGKISNWSCRLLLYGSVPLRAQIKVLSAGTSYLMCERYCFAQESLLILT